MAIFSFLIGSTVGLFCTILGWTAFGMSFLSGLGLYLTLSITIGTLLILANMETGHDADTIEA